MNAEVVDELWTAELQDNLIAEMFSGSLDSTAGTKTGSQHMRQYSWMSLPFTPGAGAAATQATYAMRCPVSMMPPLALVYEAPSGLSGLTADTAGPVVLGM